MIKLVLVGLLLYFFTPAFILQIVGALCVAHYVFKVRIHVTLI